MKNTQAMQPTFLGGSVAEHVLFVVALCRYQHHTLPLASVHYVTWSVVHLALHAVAFGVAGPTGNLALGALTAAWCIRMDPGVGVLFGLMQYGYALAARALLTGLDVPPGLVLALAPVCVVAGIALEAASHVVLQGYPPRPPARDVASLPRSHKAAFVPYFVILFGLFFLTLDLAMRFVGHRKTLHRRVNEVARAWHEEAVVSGAPPSRETHLHRRALVELL